MGMIAKQSIYNVISIALAFVLGAVNMLYLYPTYPGKEFQGLVTALLANSNLIQPFISFGVQHALIKYFSKYESPVEKDRLLWFVLLFPLLILLLIIPFYVYYSDTLLNFLSNDNDSVGRFPLMILSISIATAYFEIFFSWLRVHLKSVFGNFLKEFYPRLLIFTLLIAYTFRWIDLDAFILLLIVGYYFRLLLIMIACFQLYFPKFDGKLPRAWKEIFNYSGLIFLSGAAASFILDIDKSMINAMLDFESVAFYAVALYMASTIEAPSRAMFQITSPLVATAINAEDDARLSSLLKKSSANLLAVSGLVFLLVNLNLTDMYVLINQEGYSTATGVVVIVSVGKLFSNSLGCLNNIISNSKYYRYVFWISVSAALLAVALNYNFIQSLGILGAAYATLLVIFVTNVAKLILIYKTFGIHPYSLNTFKILLCLLLIYALMEWIPWGFSPLLNILLKSITIGGVFVLAVIQFQLSQELINLYHNVRKQLF